MTTIYYRLNSSGYVRLNVFNSSGSLVGTLVNEYKNEGDHSVRFDGSSLSGGVYFYKLDVKNHVASVLGSTTSANKIVLIR